MRWFFRIPLFLLMVPFLFPLQSQIAVTGKKEQILFAVWAPQKGKTPEAYLVDPITRINKGVFSSPLPESNDLKAAWDHFEKEYFVPGQSFPLLFGGSELGSVTILKAETISCESTTATVKVSRPTPAGLDGLAVSSMQGIRIHDNWRHLASEE